MGVVPETETRGPLWRPAGGSAASTDDKDVRLSYHGPLFPPGIPITFVAEKVSLALPNQLAAVVNWRIRKTLQNPLGEWVSPEWFVSTVG